MADIFVSYARADRERVAPLVAALAAQGWSIWWDPEIKPGEEFDRLISQELNAAKAVIVVWTPTSVESRWVRGEARLAADRGVLLPVRFDRAKLPIDALVMHTTDLDDWKDGGTHAGFDSLVRALRTRIHGDDAILQKPATPTLNALPVQPKVGSSWLTDNRTMFVSLLAAAAIVVVASLAFALLKRSPEQQAQTAPSPAVSAIPSTDTAARGVSLAVLPFVNMSGDKEQEYFSDGLSEELLSALAQMKTLRVAGRTSSFAFKGKNEDLREIAKALGVNHLLEGSVRKAGNQLRVTAQLIDGADGSQIWSKSYDRELKDVFQVQEDIAQDVARAMSVALGVGDASRPEGGTENLDAYDKYLRARELMHQLGRSEVERAVGLYQEAVALDPNFALAWYGLYSANSEARIYLPERAKEASEGLANAARHLDTLAPNAWWTKSMQAANFASEYKWSEAMAAAKAAADTAPPSETEANTVFAQVLGAVGESKRAVEVLKQARQTDPLSLSVSGFLQLMQLTAGQFEESHAEYLRSEGLAGDHGRWEWFEVARLWRNSPLDQAAVDGQYQKYLATETLPLKINKVLPGKLSDDAYVRKALHQLLDDPAAQDVSSLTVLAFWADHYGDKELVLAALQRQFIDAKSPQVGAIWSPWQTDIRSDPRFKDIVRAVGLYDYWRASGQWGDYCHPIGANDFECN